MIDHALWFFTALTESPTARSSQLSPSMMLTVRRASLKLKRQVDIDMRSTLERKQVKRCLHAHVKIGYGTNCHVSTSLQYFSIGRSGNGSSYLQNTFRVPTSQWMSIASVAISSRVANQLPATMPLMTAWTPQRTYLVTYH